MEFNARNLRGLGSGLICVFGACGFSCAGPIAAPMAAIPPYSLMRPAKGDKPATPRKTYTRFQFQGAGGAYLSHGTRRELRLRKPLYSFETRLYSEIIRWKLELGVEAYATNLGIENPGMGLGLAFRRRFDVRPRFSIAPSVGAGSTYVDAHGAWAFKYKPGIWIHGLFGGRYSAQGFALHTAAGIHHRVSPTVSVQVAVGTHYYIMADDFEMPRPKMGQDHGPWVEVLPNGVEQAVGTDIYNRRLWSPFLSVGPVWNFR